MHYDLGKHFFSNRIVAIWHSLPNIVASAESTNIFKHRLDKFWANQDFKFDWNTDINQNWKFKLCVKVYNCVKIWTQRPRAWFRQFFIGLESRHWQDKHRLHESKNTAKAETTTTIKDNKYEIA